MSGITVFNTNEVETKKQPMFFGQPLGVQRYDGSKYPLFEKLTQQQVGYFWRPEEVSLQKDRSDYQNLSPEQKHIFTSNLNRTSLAVLILYSKFKRFNLFLLYTVMQSFYEIMF